MNGATSKMPRFIVVACVGVWRSLSRQSMAKVASEELL